MGATKPGPKPRLSEQHKDWLRALDAEGIPRREIARRFTAETGIPVSVHLLHRTLKRDLDAKTLREPARADVRMEAADLEAAREIARRLGYVSYEGRGVGTGSLSGLIAAIGRGEVAVKLAS
jgi:hypothetical protein